MNYFVLGCPHPFANWCVEIVSALRRREGRRVAAVRADRLVEAAVLALSAAEDDVVHCVESPDDALAEVVARAPAGPILALADPVAALLDASLRSGPPFHVFARVVAASAAVDAARSRPDALVVDASEAARDPLEAILRIAGHVVGRPDADAHAPDLLAAVGPPPDEDALPEATAAARLAELTGSPRRARAMIDALDAYRGGRFDPLQPHVLGGSLFSDGTPRHEELGERIDVTGAARFLVVGPGLRLPLGDWDARFVLEVSDAATEGRYKADVAVYAQGRLSVLAEAIFTAAAPGMCAMTLSFRHREPEGALQYRLLSDQATFDGWIALRRVELTRRAETAASPRR